MTRAPDAGADAGAGVTAAVVVAVVIGVSGSGKSTVGRLLAADLGWVFAEGDDFHPAVNVAKMAAGHPLDDSDRRPWLAAIAEWIGASAAAGRSAVVSCSALKRSYRDALRADHPAVRFVALVGDPAVLARRVGYRRGHFMPAQLLASQLATFEPLQPDEPGRDFDVAPPARVVAAEAAAWLRATTPAG